ncbi:helix-turn-helix transcriptional regulator [Microbacterium sp.]|uniref:helix-turn-helix transcriptional regulator n=1 Tax=Microbacterium sp. TaxID=51671 RepID=UPI003A8D0154
MIVSTAADWGNVVRDRRIELGLTQAELARRVGRARQWVVRFESGFAGSASVDSLLAVLDILDLYVEVGETDEDTTNLDER